MLHAFLYGVFLAFGLITPLGIQNIFLFNQGATQKHFIHALPSVITAGICDAILIMMAVLGVSVIVLTIPWLKTAIFMIGFIFLIYMGWITFNTAASQSNVGSKALSAKRQIGFAMSVSILNPHAIIDSIGVIGTNSLHFMGNEKVVFTAACISVSFIWFFSMAVMGHFVHRVDKGGMLLRYINKFSAFIIWAVAGYIGWQLVH